MKTETVRIQAGQAKQLREVASQIANPSIRWMVERGIELFLIQEAPVYIDAFKEARKKLRHPVKTES